jgi:hypothetical protein
MVDQERPVRETGAGETTGVSDGSDITRVQVDPDFLAALNWLQLQIGKVFLYCLKFGDYGPDVVLQSIMLSLIHFIGPTNPDYLQKIIGAAQVADRQHRSKE